MIEIINQFIFAQKRSTFVRFEECEKVKKNKNIKGFVEIDGSLKFQQENQPTMLKNTQFFLLQSRYKFNVNRNHLG